MPGIRSVLDMGASVDRVNAFVGRGAQASRRARAFIHPSASRIDQIEKKSINDRVAAEVRTLEAVAAAVKTGMAGAAPAPVNWRSFWSVFAQ